MEVTARAVRVVLPARDPEPGACVLNNALAASAAALLLYLGVASMFLKIEVLDASTSPTVAVVGDLITYYYPTLKYGFAQVRSGNLPLWNPHQSCGSPFIAALHEGFFYPLYAPFLILSAEQAVNVHIILHLAVASLGTFLFCRHVGMGMLAALLAGLVYSYQGTMMIKIYFPDFLTSSAWIPWLFLCADRTLLHPSRLNAAALASVIGVSILGGHGVQFLYFTFLALIPLVVWRSVARLRGGAPALVGTYGMLLLAAVLGIMIGLIRLLPTAAFVNDSWRPPGGFGMQASATMPIYPKVFREGLLTPEPSRRVSLFLANSADKVRMVYVGVVPLALGLIGLVYWRPRAVAWSIATVGCAAVLYAFGTASFVFPFLFQLPGGNWFRGLDRALIIFGFAVSFLAGAGLDVLLRRTPEDNAAAVSSRWPILTVLLSVVVVFAVARMLGHPRGFPRLQIYSALGAAVLVVLVTWRSRAARVAVTCVLCALVLVDLFHAQQHRGKLPSQIEGWFSRNNDFYAAIRERQGLDRTYIATSFAETHPLRFHSDTAKAGILHGIWMITDYEPLSGARFTRFLQQFGPIPMTPIGYVDFGLSDDNIGLFELMGVRFFLLDEGRARKMAETYPELDRRWRRILQRNGISLYEYDNPMSRAFIVDRVEIEPDAERVLERMRAADLRTVAFVEESIVGGLPVRQDAPPGAARADIVAYEPNRVEIQAESATGGMLVLTDQFDPGWGATIDGQPTPIYRTDFLFRGVALPPGPHRVVFTYRPRSMTLGATGTVLGLLLTTVLTISGTRARWSH